MPNRVIRHGVLTSEEVSSLSFFSQMMFFRLIISSNDFGLHIADPKVLRKIFNDEAIPLDLISMSLEQLELKNLIRLYANKKYLKVNKYRQRIRLKRSEIPHPVAEDLEEWLDQLKDEDVVKKWLTKLGEKKGKIGVLLKSFIMAHSDTGSEPPDEAGPQFSTSYDYFFNEIVESFLEASK